MNHQKEKKRFRDTKQWKEFRRRKIEEQKTDPVTGQKLSGRCNLHHLDLNDEHYSDISHEDNFICLNKFSHDAVHFFFLKSKPSEWRKRIARIIPILERMEALNS